MKSADIGHVFLMTGAGANTGWLKGRVALDEKGLIKTGSDLTKEDLAAARWPADRSPYLLETNGFSYLEVVLPSAPKVAVGMLSDWSA